MNGDNETEEAQNENAEDISYSENDNVEEMNLDESN